MPIAQAAARAIFLAVLVLTGAASFVSAQTSAAPRYVEMTEGEKRRFIETEINRLLSLFRRVDGDVADAESVDAVKRLIDGYNLRRSRPAARTTNRTPAAKCGYGSPLADILERGAANAPVIEAAFAEKKIPVEVGLYVAMIETEFCPCLQSPTGALGMFQFTKVVGEIYGLKTVAGASPKSPDERCQAGPAARAAANYFTVLLDVHFGRNGYGLPLSLMAYNAGEGKTKALLKEARGELGKEDVSFWMLGSFVKKKYSGETTEAETETEDGQTAANDEQPATAANAAKLFKMESERYVHKFFAAAIVGENPRVFGIEAAPLSQIKAK